MPAIFKTAFALPSRVLALHCVNLCERLTKAGCVGARAFWSAAVLCRFWTGVTRPTQAVGGLAHSKTWWRFVAPFCILAALFANVKLLEAQPATPVNRVLELDGTNSCVELPSNIFNGLTEATVEGWVKWETPGRWTRFF